VFYFNELWESHAALNAHVASSVFKEISGKTSELLREPLEVNLLKAVELGCSHFEKWKAARFLVLPPPSVALANRYAIPVKDSKNTCLRHRRIRHGTTLMTRLVPLKCRQGGVIPRRLIERRGFSRCEAAVPRESDGTFDIFWSNVRASMTLKAPHDLSCAFALPCLNLAIS
jgi:hypothetical protein